MNAIRGGGARTLQYMLLKAEAAIEDALGVLLHGSPPNPVHSVARSSAQEPTKNGEASGRLAMAFQRLEERYQAPLTFTMWMAGVAMAPALNKHALKDPDAVEQLVVRGLPRPSPRSILVGDVVVLTSPLPPSAGTTGASNLMVRRVAAVEGDELVSTSRQGSSPGAILGSGPSSGSAGLGPEGSALQVLEVPKGHCWVLADNVELKPPQVMDSRTFGFVNMSSILGRVVYAGSSLQDHSSVVNNPASNDEDQCIIAAEIDPSKLFGLHNSDDG